VTDLIQKGTHCLVQIVRLLHRQYDKVVIRWIDQLRSFGIEASRQVNRAYAAGGGFAPEREIDLCAPRVDQLGRSAAADKGYVMDRHQKFGAEQRSVRR